jgi:hypothetical protein
MTTMLSDPAERRMFWADGCQRTRPTRRWCFNRSTMGSVIVLKIFAKISQVLFISNKAFLNVA